jgi:hypothetical protein
MQGKTKKNVTANMQDLLPKLHTALSPIQDHSVLFFQTQERKNPSNKLHRGARQTHTEGCTGRWLNYGLLSTEYLLYLGAAFVTEKQVLLTYCNIKIQKNAGTFTFSTTKRMITILGGDAESSVVRACAECSGSRSA